MQGVDRWLSGRRRALLDAALLTAASNAGLAVLVQAVGGGARLVALVAAHAAVAAAVFVAAMRRPRIGPPGLAAGDLLLFAPYYVSLELGWPVLARLADPLFAAKLLAVGLAVLVPSTYRLHLVMLAGLLAQAVIHGARLAPAAGISTEPWATLVFFVVTGWFLTARWRRHQFEQEIDALRVRAEALSRVAKVFLAVRHLANTPLQKIALVASMFRRGAPPTPERLEALERALGDLEALLAEFRRYDDLLADLDEGLNLNARRELERLLSDRP